jgi:hypothetical protein
MDIFVPIRFRTSIQLSPSDLVANFEDVLVEKVRGTLEGVCSRFGYIRPGSIAIVRRSAGSFIKQHFNGHIKFDMICKAEVCNPSIGAIFQAVVKNKNALGIHAESVINKDETVLDIIIPKRSVGIVSTVNLEDVQIGDTIYVEVLGKRYQLNDTKISIIGRAITPPSTAPVVPDYVDDIDEALDDDVPPLEADDADQFVEGAEAEVDDGPDGAEGDEEVGDDEDEDDDEDAQLDGASDDNEDDEAEPADEEEFSEEVDDGEDVGGGYDEDDY